MKMKMFIILFTTCVTLVCNPVINIHEKCLRTHFFEYLLKILFNSVAVVSLYSPNKILDNLISVFLLPVPYLTTVKVFGYSFFEKSCFFFSYLWTLLHNLSKSTTLLIAGRPALRV